MPEGKEGKKEFLDRLHPVLPPEAVSHIKHAYRDSKFSHRWQKRKSRDENGDRIRYFEHCRAAALIYIDEVGGSQPEMIISLLDHDLLEDTDVTAIDLGYWYGPYSREVARIVRLVSKVPEEGYVERLNRYADWKALMVKACDRLANLRDLEDTEPEFRRKQARETREKYFPLFDRMVEMTPPEWRVGAEYLRSEIRKITAGYDTVSAPDGGERRRNQERSESATDGGLHRARPPHQPPPESGSPRDS
ncbi:HD domain-containing protein [Patescibacteria group bacterium]